MNDEFGVTTASSRLCLKISLLVALSLVVAMACKSATPGSTVSQSPASVTPSPSFRLTFIDWEFYVRNQTDQTWLLRVEVGGPSDGDRLVTSIGPGAVGVGVEYWGDKNKPIELLNDQCQVIGIFQAASGGAYLVAGVAGLEGSIFPGGTHINERNLPGLMQLRRCGGE